MTSEERELERKRRREEREEQERQRELEELDRDTRTVFAYNLSTKADERNIYEFFSQAGPVLDVRIIYDRNTPRSKGMAYVEFADQDSVPNGLALTGQVLKNQVVMVKSSEAEKNIAWEAQQAQKQMGMGTAPVANVPAAAPANTTLNVNAAAMSGGVGPCKLYVGGLHPNIQTNDLKAIFEPFGMTDFITIQKDEGGRNQGYGFVQYRLTQNAMLAINQLNGLELVGQALKVSIATTGSTTSAPAIPVGGDLDEETEGLKMDSRSRAALMARLSGQDASTTAPVGIDPATGLPHTAESLAKLKEAKMPVAAQPITQGVLGPASPIPTQCLLLKNLFDPAEETEPEWHIEIGEDVKEECSKYGAVTHIHVDKDSSGFVYLKFEAVDGCQKAQQALHSRWFAGRMIAAEFQFTAVYNNHFEIK